MIFLFVIHSFPFSPPSVLTKYVNGTTFFSFCFVLSFFNNTVGTVVGPLVVGIRILHVPTNNRRAIQVAPPIVSGDRIMIATTEDGRLVASKIISAVPRRCPNARRRRSLSAQATVCTLPIPDVTKMVGPSVVSITGAQLVPPSNRNATFNAAGRVPVGVIAKPIKVSGTQVSLCLKHLLYILLKTKYCSLSLTLFLSLSPTYTHPPSPFFQECHGVEESVIQVNANQLGPRVPLMTIAATIFVVLVSIANPVTNNLHRVVRVFLSYNFYFLFFFNALAYYTLYNPFLFLISTTTSF